MKPFFILILVALYLGCSAGGDTKESNSVSGFNGKQSKAEIWDSGDSNAETAGSSDKDLSGPNCDNAIIESADDITALGNCTSITGNLRISNTAIDVTDLNGLHSIVTIEGDLVLQGESLVDISGLSGVTSIVGTLYIKAPSLTNLVGLQNLVTVEDALFVGYCHALTSLNGLNGLVSVGGKLTLQDDAVLSDISALDSLTTLSKVLFIKRVPLLPTCDVIKLEEKLGKSAVDEPDSDESVVCGTLNDECGGVDCQPET